MVDKKERNNNIDFLRGIAFISIVLIHTAWFSGEKYLPQWFGGIFLLVDVPVFMFLAGLSYNYVNSVGKNIKNILSIWNKWIFFLLFYYLILIVFFPKEFFFSDILESVFFRLNVNSLQGVHYSIWWFIPTYIKVTIFCTIILHFWNKYKTIEFKHLLFIILLLYCCNIPGIDSYVYIYSFIYLLGYYSYDNKIKKVKSFLMLELLMILSAILIFLIGNYDLSDLQMLKFSPTWEYLMASMPSIILFWFLKDKIMISSKNPINYFGKNCLFFYFAQGISSSILFFIEPLMKFNIYFKFVILFIINLIIAVIIGIIINESYKFVRNFLSKKDLKLI